MEAKFFSEIEKKMDVKTLKDFVSIVASPFINMNDFNACSQY